MNILKKETVMNLGYKIKQLRYKSGLTQEQLASRLGISAQSVSKWETSVTMPDITLLPLLAGEFGVTIDELFDLTIDYKLNRIERCIETEDEIAPDLFREYEDLLKNQLLENEDRERVLSLLAGLYYNRMEADAKKVSRYAREAIKLMPQKKSCQWFLNIAEGQFAWDWNIREHSSIIDFYKEIVASDNGASKSPLPYYYLIDNLIADRRVREAREYLEEVKRLPDHKPFLITVYRANIALAEFDEAEADGIIESGLKEFSGNSGFLFEAAQYYAGKCEYEKALRLYEDSWCAEENAKPRYTDALYGMARIYKIMGEGKKLAATYDRIIYAMKTEWGFSEDDSAIIEAEQEKKQMLSK